MAKKKQTKKAKKQMSQTVKAVILIVAALLFAFVVVRSGAFGIYANNFIRYFFGEWYIFLAVTGLMYGLYDLWLHNKMNLTMNNAFGVIVINIAIVLLSALFEADSQVGMATITTFFARHPITAIANTTYVSFGGGLIGALIYAPIGYLFSETGTLVFGILLVLMGLGFIIPTSFYGYVFSTMSQKHAEAKLARKQHKAEKEEARLKAKETLMIEENERMRERDLLETQHTEQSLLTNNNNHHGSVFIDSDEQPQVEEPKQEVMHSNLFLDIDIEPSCESGENDNISLMDPNAVHDDVQSSRSVTANDETSHQTKHLKVDPYINYKLPNEDVFEKYVPSKTVVANKKQADLDGVKLIKILENFGIKAELINTHVGPSVTKFEVKPDSSVKVSRIQNISDNIKMELAARDIRIEAPIPGRNAVGIEIPNLEPTPVRMQELVRMLPPNKKTSSLMFFVGKDLLGKLVTCDIDKMPHLLIAGATGSGKSVCINAIITSLLYRTKPDEVKLVLVDPKKVEFTPYHDVPHLLWPVITDAAMANLMLKKVVVMMEERFDIFADYGVRNINSYNDLVNDFNAKNTDEDTMMPRMPKIVVIIDELADLMMIAGKEVESSIQRITQLARAAGIHLVIATQRPSTDVITGIIKSNIPSRISFSVASSIDSRTILDQGGAERLLGNGDMLYAPQNEPSPIRLQGVYIKDKEVKSITDYVKKQARPNYDDAYFEFLNASNQSNSEFGTKKEKDALYDEVKAFVIDAQKASTSLLQRKFSIGYNRAAGLIESLQENGVIGPQNGSKPREVYMKKEGNQNEE